MSNDLLEYVVALYILFVQLVVAPLPAVTPSESESADLSSKVHPPTACRSAPERTLFHLCKTRPVQVEVISFTRLESLPEHIPACEGCRAVAVFFRITCTNLDGCEDLSVMDFYLTYESAYPILFYGDAFPNPALQGQNYAGIIYGAQKEFSKSSFAPREMAMGKLSFTVKPDASNFVLHYQRDGQDAVAVPVQLTEDIQ